MKLINKLSVLLIAIVAFVSGCKKDDKQIFLEGGTAPVLSASVSGTIPLSFINKDNEALKISWTNPNYKMSTGISSQDVNYLLDIDTTGANFTNPNRQTLSFSKDLTRSLKQSELNDYLLNQLLLKPGMPHNIEMRVKSTLGANSSAPLISNVLKFTVTPYAIPPKVDPPASGRLFIVGSATPGGWDNPVPAVQELTKVSSLVYEITLQLTGGGSYLLLPVNGSWDTKYGGIGSNNGNNPSGDDFKIGGADVIAPVSSGKYKISFDFQRGKFTVTPQ